MSYVPSTPEQRQEMLRALGLRDYRDLYRDVPEEMLLDRELDLPAGMSELEARRAMEDIAAENLRFRHIFRGAGAYNHYIPAIVKAVVIRVCVGGVGTDCNFVAIQQNVAVRVREGGV